MRLHDWQMRFAEFARARQGESFAWGCNDCFLFAADCVLAITGDDPAADLRGKYASALQAARILRARGGMASLGAVFGAPIPAAMAAVGDVVLVEIAGREAFGICNGTSVIGPGPCGMASCGMGPAKAAWRIG